MTLSRTRPVGPGLPSPFFVFLVGLLLLATSAAQAARITRVSPQGEVPRVRQVVIGFDAAVVPLGDLRRPAPVSVTCRGAPAVGSGRWNNDREWAFDFNDDLPPGTRCDIEAKADWKPLDGTLAGPTRFQFNTGGPALLRTRPYNGATVEEDPLFVLELSGPVVEADLPSQVWCEVDGLGERLPVRLAAPAERDAILKAQRLDKLPPGRALVLGCGRPLPPKAKLRLVWGKGVASRDAPQLRTTVEQRFNFQVREPFTAEFSCERERAQAPCMPIRPLVVRLSSPVLRTQAAAARLHPVAGGPAIAPRFDASDTSAEVSELRFEGLFAERARYRIELPAGLKDLSGRTLANAASFPLTVATGEAPPIAKFAAAPFGVVEWTPDAALPLTLRHVQADLRPAAPSGQVRVKTLQTDADILRWYRKLHRYHESQLTARELGRPQTEWTMLVEQEDAQGRMRKQRVDRYLATREVPLLADEREVRRLDLPQLQGGDPRPFEVVGIPLPTPGFQVVEVVSSRLGAALLDKAAPMFVRTGVLVTNLGVHFKQGRENAVVWVTSLDRGRPVAGADVAVSDCTGKAMWQGKTDEQGLARVPRALVPPDGCDEPEALFVSARKADAKGVVDTAFVFNSWTQGIEPWRFHVPTSDAAEPDRRAHTVFDRTLLRAGETVSMKHFIRRESAAGLALLPTDELPTRLKIVHVGTGDEVTQPLSWTDGRSSTSRWNIPANARLGSYRVELDRPDAPEGRRRSWTGGDFRVEEFRVPLVDARLFPPRSAPVAPADVAIGAQFSYLSGGAMARAPLKASAVLRPRETGFPGHEGFSFEPPRVVREGTVSADAEPETEAGPGPGNSRVVADQVALTTDAQGAATFTVKPLPAVTRPSELLAEISFNDPNGEVQTVATTVPLWPSAVVLGVKAGSWVRHRGQARVTVLALDTRGQLIQGQAVTVRGRLVQTFSTRKRMVGGFYSYDNRTEVKDLGPLCSGKTDDRGQLACTATLDTPGQVELIASAADAGGRTAEAATGIWVTQQGEQWFAQDNDDRIDVLPEKARYEPGETARLQVRMPFRQATALVAIEREGVIDTRVVTLRGDDPTIELPIDKAWAPNVYVSVLALRGRVRDVTWTSFFRWGWREPVEWARAFWYEGRAYQAPTAMVDLSKPAFKLGVAALRVGLAAHELQVSVTPDQPQYGVRGTARVRVKVTQGNQPVAGAELAFAAVDEGLLALRDNTSWQLLTGLFQARPWGVQTATAHGEIIGRRHYGRKAVAAGGSGGRGATRELFDTLLLWQPRVKLDAQGEALVEVPLNDALTAFRLVAVADAGADRFGTGSAQIRVTQDLQVLSGLPPLVRDGDRFTALLTLRNTTARAMTVRATLQGTAHRGNAGSPDFTRLPLALPAQDVTLPPGAAQELQWPVDVPADVFSIGWEAGAQEQGGKASDRLKLTQLVVPSVPVRVLQASLQQLDGSLSLPVAAPADALAVAGSTDGTKRGGLLLGLQPRLTGALPGIRRYFETYPFSCLEQKVSKAVGLRDAALWTPVAGALAGYLDSDGLATYFPLRPGDAPSGSDRLTAYLLAATHEAGFELPAAARDRMLAGLAAFVEGRIERRFWSPRADLDVRKLAALEALARHGRAEPRMLGSIALAPGTWPTAALIDWLQILRRLNGIPDQARRLAEAEQLLRARLQFAGTTLRFSTEADDFWWWLMDSPDANAARLILAVHDLPGWAEDMPRLVVGALARQQRGAWATTTANLWGSLALDRFAARFESTPVGGRTVATAAQASRTLDWSASRAGGQLELPWPATPAPLTVQHDGTGKPWLTVQSTAAIPLQAPLAAGYTVTRTVTAVTRKDPARWSRGDVLRVRLQVDAAADRTWVVVADPVPAGATLLGTGLGRDSQIGTQGEQAEGRAWPAFQERGFDAFRSYYAHLPRGRHVVEYSLRLNNPGRFLLPPTRVEAMYAPETFGEAPNAPIEVAP